MPEFREQRSVATRSAILTPHEVWEALQAIGIVIPEHAQLMLSGYDPTGKIHGVTMPLGELHLAVAWSETVLPEEEAHTALRRAVYANEISHAERSQSVQCPPDTGGAAL